MAETLILDPTSEDAANAQLDITGTGYGLLEHHYPQPPVAAQWASSVDTEGSRLGSVKHENRQISITLDVSSLSALRALQAKLGKLHREGGTLKRTLNDATVIVFDVLTVEGYDPEFSYSFDLATVTTVPFTLTCLPYGRGPEEDLGDNVETTLPFLIFTETGVKGDMPALGRLVVDNDSASFSQTVHWWGIQSRYYDATATAALFYQAESCALLTAATAVGPAGASGAGSNVAQITSYSFADTYQGLVYLGTSSTAQTHIGNFRVYARVWLPVSNTGLTSLRCVWSPYIGALSVTNTPVLLDGASIEGQWLLVDLGMVSIPKAIKGNQGWVGKIEGASTVTTDDIMVDYVALLPADEGFGVASTNVATSGGQIEIRHDGVIESLAGGRWRKPASYEGDYLRVPPAGAEARTVRVITKFATTNTPTGTQGIVGDTSIDDLSAHLFVTPRYLVVPSA